MFPARETSRGIVEIIIVLVVAVVTSAILFALIPIKKTNENEDSLGDVLSETNEGESFESNNPDEAAIDDSSASSALDYDSQQNSD